jgi:hypothetical protein
MHNLCQLQWYRTRSGAWPGLPAHQLLAGTIVHDFDTGCRAKISFAPALHHRSILNFEVPLLKELAGGERKGRSWRQAVKVSASSLAAFRVVWVSITVIMSICRIRPLVFSDPHPKYSDITVGTTLIVPFERFPTQSEVVSRLSCIALEVGV